MCVCALTFGVPRTSAEQTYESVSSLLPVADILYHTPTNIEHTQPNTADMHTVQTDGASQLFTTAASTCTGSPQSSLECGALTHLPATPPGS